MNPAQIIGILRARQKLALVAFLLTVATATALSLLSSKVYKSTTTIIVNYRGADPVSGMVLPAQLVQGYLATQVDIIRSKNVALKVVDTLQMEKSPAVISAYNRATDGRGTVRDWLAGVLLRRLTVEPSRESNAISITFEGGDPAYAAQMANAFADAYIKTSLELRVEPSMRAAGWFEEQVNGLRSDLQAAQKKLSDYQQEKGIVSLDERLDVENARFAQISNQLVAAQMEAVDLRSRQAKVELGDRLDEHPDLMKDPIIQNLTVSLTKAEGSLVELEHRYNTNHPSYLSALAEVRNLRQKLEDELEKASSSLRKGAALAEQRAESLNKALEAQKTNLLQINQQRDAMNVLQSEVENARRTLELSMQRASQAALEGQVNYSDVSVLNPAVPPISHSSPRIKVNIALSLFLGGLLGVAASLVRELLDRRLRTPEDLSETLQIPVLAYINEQKEKPVWPVNFRNYASGGMRKVHGTT